VLSGNCHWRRQRRGAITAAAEFRTTNISSSSAVVLLHYWVQTLTNNQDTMMYRWLCHVDGNNGATYCGQRWKSYMNCITTLPIHRDHHS
jgi:hypothetical protein